MTPQTSVQVRRASPGDAAALARLRLEFRGPRAPAVETEAEFLERCTAWMRARLTPGSAWRVWALDLGGEPIGNIWLQVVEKLPNPTAEPELHGYVSNFYISPHHRNAGGGSALLADALAECKRLSVDTVFLWPSARSRPLYHRHGFTTTDGVLVLSSVPR